MDGIEKGRKIMLIIKTLPPLPTYSSITPNYSQGYSACTTHSNTQVCCLETAKCTVYIFGTWSVSPRQLYAYHLITLHMKPPHLSQPSSRSGKGKWWVTTGSEQCCDTGMKWSQELSMHVLCYVMLTDWLWRIVGDGTVRAMSQFGNKRDLPDTNYTTFWRNLLRTSSLLPVWGKQVPQACWYSCTGTHGITSL